MHLRGTFGQLFSNFSGVRQKVAFQLFGNFWVFPGKWACSGPGASQAVGFPERAFATHWVAQAPIWLIF